MPISDRRSISPSLKSVLGFEYPNFSAWYSTYLLATSTCSTLRKRSQINKQHSCNSYVLFVGEFLLKIYRLFETSGKYDQVAEKGHRLLFLFATSFFNSRLFFSFIDHFVLTLATSVFSHDFIFLS